MTIPVECCGCGKLEKDSTEAEEYKTAKVASCFMGKDIGPYICPTCWEKIPRVKRTLAEAIAVVNKVAQRHDRYNQMV